MPKIIIRTSIMEMYLNFSSFAGGGAEVALPIHLGVLREHVEAGDPHVGEPRVADVGGVGVQLGPHLTDLHPGHQVPVLVAELDQEAEEAVVLPVDHQLGHHHAVGGGVHPGGPPLQRGQRRGVDHELVRLPVEGGGGLQRADVTAVADLGLAVGAEELPLPGLAGYS